MVNEQLNDLVSDFMRSHLRKKFSYWDPRKLESAILEFLKFFVMAGKLPGYFIPLNEDADNVWHAYILETKEYQDLCRKISPHFFLHHTGMAFSDYAANRSPHKLYEQDLTFLATYVKNFGNFTEESINYWPVASFIKKSLNWDINKLNDFCIQLVRLSDGSADLVQPGA